MLLLEPCIYSRTPRIKHPRTSPSGDAVALSQAAYVVPGLPQCYVAIRINVRPLSPLFVPVIPHAGRCRYTKYAALLLRPPLPPAPPAPPRNSTPAGYETHVGGYWKISMTHGAGHTVATCAAACTAANAGCVAFELSETGACYLFTSTAGAFIKNPQCRTFTKVRPGSPRNPPQTKCGTRHGF